MSKSEADDLKRISTSFLKKYRYLKGRQSGNITWTNNYNGHQDSVSIEVSVLNNDDYLRIHYTQTDRYTNEKKSFDYKIPLTTTACRYGGNRYWFICPWYKNKVYCGKRVSTLYKDGDLFACRHCYNLTYESRKLSGRAKIFGRIISLPEIEKLRNSVKRTHYRGRPTKKYLRYLKMEEKSEWSFIGMVGLLEERANKITRNTLGRKK